MNTRKKGDEIPSSLIISPQLLILSWCYNVLLPPQTIMNQKKKIVDFLTPPNLITQSNKLYSLIFSISMVVKKNINGKEINEIDLIEV